MPSAVIVTSDTPLMRRFAAAFTHEWLAAGGTVAQRVPLRRHRGDALTAMRRELTRRPPSPCCSRWTARSAALAKPYLGTRPAYASALVFERETTSTVRDLDGLILTEIPWIVTPERAAVRAACRGANFPAPRSLACMRSASMRFASRSVSATGVPSASRSRAPPGQVTLVDGRQFAREGRFAVFRDGTLIPLDGPR